MAEPLEYSDVTLIIPTYNRSHLLARLLNYYYHYFPNLTILVLDSSDAYHQAQNYRAINSKGANITYKKFPPSLPVGNKLCEGLKEVKTSYCAFCADDDLVFVDALSKAKNYLEKNIEYVCVDGIYLNFQQIQHQINLHVEYASKGIDANHAGSRIFRLYQKYESLFYGLFRTKNAKLIFEAMRQIPSLHYQELFQSTAALIIGKTHRLPLFYAGRQSCEPADAQRKNWQTYYWFCDHPEEFVEHYCDYRKVLWQFYVDHHSDDKPLNKDEFKKLMDLAHTMYFSIGCPPKYFYATLSESINGSLLGDPDDYEYNILNQVKSFRRVNLERRINRLTDWLIEKVNGLYSSRDLKKLNTKITTLTNHPWTCQLNPNVRWFASNTAFRSAYLELCRYLSD